MTTDELRTEAEQYIRQDSVGLTPSGDVSEVCRQWLADHPADDAEPVTAAWLDTLTRDKDADHHWRLADGPRADGVMSVEVVLRATYCTVWVRHVLIREWWPLADDAGERQYTRGDLRRLCAALGVPLHPAATSAASAASAPVA
jgi:hypothetical protein